MRVSQCPQSFRIMELVVDVQGFKQPNNNFVVKELALAPLNTDEGPTSYLFKPPFDWTQLPAKYKSENLWVERNYHGLSWNSGDVPYEKLEEIFLSLTTSGVYVKGLEKTKWVTEILEQSKNPTTRVINMEDLGCPSLKSLQMNCCHHQSRKVLSCAIENVKLLKNWLLEYFANNPTRERSLELFFALGEDLTKMREEDIALLSKEFLTIFASRSIEHAWDKLPIQYKNDKDIAECRQCLKHRDKNEVNNPAPMIKYCEKCQMYTQC